MTTGDEAMPTTDMVLPILSFLIMMLTLFNTWNFDKNWFRKFCISATEHTRNQTSVDRSHKYVLITGTVHFKTSLFYNIAVLNIRSSITLPL